MAIIIANDGDKIVQTIAERNAIAKKFPGLQVTVIDAIADPQTNGGYAKYEWIEDGLNSRWGLVQVDQKASLKFATESHTITLGVVTSDYIPLDGGVWNARIIDSVSGQILADARPVVNNYELDIGTTQYDGQLLEFTYSYGSFSAQLDSVFYDLKDKHTGMTTSVIDLPEASVFTKTITENTNFSVIDTEATGIVDSFVLELTNAGSFTIGWPTGVIWDKGIAPTLTTGIDILGFYTYDEGTTWRGVLIGSDMKASV